MVSFEKEDRNTIIYPINVVPAGYKEGGIIKAIIHESHSLKSDGIFPALL